MSAAKQAAKKAAKKAAKNVAKSSAKQAAKDGAKGAAKGAVKGAKSGVKSEMKRGRGKSTRPQSKTAPAPIGPVEPTAPPKPYPLQRRGCCYTSEGCYTETVSRTVPICGGLCEGNQETRRYHCCAFRTPCGVLDCKTPWGCGLTELCSCEVDRDPDEHFGNCHCVDLDSVWNDEGCWHVKCEGGHRSWYCYFPCVWKCCFCPCRSCTLSSAGDYERARGGVIHPAQETSQLDSGSDSDFGSAKSGSRSDWSGDESKSADADSPVRV